jgi:PPOX class probable F420-dependent enzyme
MSSAVFGVGLKESISFRSSFMTGLYVTTEGPARPDQPFAVGSLSVRKRLAVEDLGDLLEQPLLAVLATHRRDGNVLLSPVWHEWRDGGFNVATGSGGAKTRQLRRDPRASIVVCEQSPPYRGIELRGQARLLAEGVADAALRIAIRYLGPDEGRKQAARLADDTLIRLEPGNVRAWDFADEYT